MQRLPIQPFPIQSAPVRRGRSTRSAGEAGQGGVGPSNHGNSWLPFHSGVGMDQLAGGSVVNRQRLAAPTYVEAADPLAGAFGGLALFGALIVVFGGFVVANAVFDTHPDFLRQLYGQPGSNGMLYLLGAVVGAVIFFAVGWVVGIGSAR